MPTIHGTPAGVSCILFSSPGSWDHREGDRQQSDSSSQEPSPQQRRPWRRRMWKSGLGPSDWKWAFFSMPNFEDRGPDNWPSTNLNHLLCNCLSVSNSAWKKSSSLAARRPGWGHPTCHESLQPWGQGMLGCCWLHQNNCIIENCFNFSSIFHLCAPFAGTGTDLHQ